MSSAHDQAAVQSRAVPARYRGVWRRTLLSTPEASDTDTTVLWMQAASWHADLRIPAGRPDFSGVHSLRQCSRAQHLWLARQQGFAGITHIEAAPRGQDICRWQRLADFQPPAGSPDAGFLRFKTDDAAKLIETGVHAPYLENWERLPESNAGFAVLRQCDEDSSAAAPMRLLLVAGAWVMHVRAGRPAWPQDLQPGIPLADLMRQSPQQAGALLDFEIAFGRRTDDGWSVLHATLPWLEGRHVPMRLERIDGDLAQVHFGRERALWRMLEWNPPNA